MPDPTSAGQVARDWADGGRVGRDAAEHDWIMPHDTRYDGLLSCPPNCPYRLRAERRQPGITAAAKAVQDARYGNLSRLADEYIASLVLRAATKDIREADRECLLSVLGEIKVILAQPASGYLVDAVPWPRVLEVLRGGPGGP